MAEMQEAAPPDDTAIQDWPWRPWVLAGLLGLVALGIHFATCGNGDVPWRMAAASFLFFGAIAAAFTLEKDSWKGPAIFAVAIGAVMAGLAWRAVRYGEYLPDEQYGFAAGVLASGLALPLFQAGFLKRRMATSYSDLHYHVWTDAISAAGALAFTGLSWLVLVLLSALFQLLKIDVLANLMDEGWFGWTFSGLAFGAALGTLRNQLKVLGTLQSVLLLVLSLLAVPLALGLTVFLLATVISGPQVLWDATRSATPVLLSCAAGAWVLASAIVRYDDAAMSRNRVMRVAALVLAAVILPLAVFAAVSMGLRLGQHGLAPARLWGLAAIVVACACGLGFWGALVRGRKGGWTERMRRANFHLGLFVCGLAVVLALPIFDFGAISTRDQVARLENGTVPPEMFDYSALRWDFGKAGQDALERMAASDDETVASLAAAALEEEFRSYVALRPAEEFALRVQPDDPELRALVLDYLVRHPWLCSEGCVAIDVGGADRADGAKRVAIISGERAAGFSEVLLAPRRPGQDLNQATREAALPALTGDSVIEIRTVEKRYIFVDGKPLSLPLD